MDTVIQLDEEWRTGACAGAPTFLRDACALDCTWQERHCTRSTSAGLQQVQGISRARWRRMWQAGAIDELTAPWHAVRFELDQLKKEFNKCTKEIGAKFKVRIAF